MNERIFHIFCPAETEKNGSRKYITMHHYCLIFDEAFVRAIWQINNICRCYKMALKSMNMQTELCNHTLHNYRRCAILCGLIAQLGDFKVYRAYLQDQRRPELSDQRTLCLYAYCFSLDCCNCASFPCVLAAALRCQKAM